jgi:chromate transporter
MDQVSPSSGYLSKHRLLEVIGLFLKLGAITFGGPAAGAALMEQEVVGKRRWLSSEHFLDLLAATNLVPGANVVEMAVHVGYLRAGWPGLVAGGVAFILPAFLISLGLSVVYVRLGALPQGAALFYGINPAVMAIILVATYRLGRTALKDKWAIGLAVASLAAALLGVNEVVVLLAAGLALFRSAIVDGWTALLLLVGVVALLRFRLDTLWLVAGGAGAGLAHYLLRGG